MAIVSYPKSENAALDKLAAELRNRIFELALVPKGPIYLNSELVFKEPGLLKTNRMLRKEGTAIYYGQNKFCISGSPHSFLSRLAKNDKLKLVRCLMVQVNTLYLDIAKSYWIGMMQVRMKDLVEDFGPEGLRAEALMMPLKVDGEERESWVTLEESKRFEALVLDGKATKRIARK